VLVALSHCIDGSISRHWQKLQSLTKLVAQSFCSVLLFSISLWHDCLTA